MSAMDTLRRYTHCASVESLASSLFEQDEDSIPFMAKDTYGKYHGIGQKWAVMAHYTNDGGLIYCAQCGDTNLRNLEIDHMNGDGTEFRKKYLPRCHNQYGFIIKMGYPDDWGLQVLCATCNSSKPKLNRTINLTVNLNFAFNWDDPIPDVRPVSLWGDA